MTEFVSSILESFVEKLASSAVKEIQLVRGVKEDQEALKDMLEIIQTVVPDAERKQTKYGAVRHWLSKLEDFCYDAEDVLDEFEAKALWRQARSTEHSTFKRKVCYLFSWKYNFKFQFKVAHKMKELRRRLHGIFEEKTKFDLLSDVEANPLRETHWKTHHFLPLSSVIGRNSEKESIIEQLIGSDDGGARTIAVVPIIGMGGIGKTTLAKLVYHDDRVKKHFDLRAWVCMPVEFEAKKVIRHIIKDLGSKEEYDELDVLQNCLRSIVENKRCLLVMDDLWELKEEDWVGLRDLLGGASKGSRVIVTSRHRWIAEIMGTVPPLHLANLSEEDSRTLFVKYAFNQGQEKNHPDLMAVGEEIVRKCEGHPMAVQSLGSLLYANYNQSKWEYVRDSEMWQLPTEVLPSLKISYDLMPSHLKRCFAFCSIFPKSHEFSDYELISLWMSNGFIQPTRDNQELEEIGRQYVDELHSRSFFDVVKEDHPFLTLKMPGHIHELAVSVAPNESFNLEERGLDISLRTRHISLLHPSRIPKDELDSYLSKLSHARTVRTVRTVVFDKFSSREFLMETCTLRFKFLRVLWLEDASLDLLPSSIGGLKHLRCLHLGANCDIKNLPGSICELRNLQWLVLIGCEELEELPANIKNMNSLRVLMITTKQQHLPRGGIGCLTSLRWLLIRWCENLEALFDDIQSLTSLRKLMIIGCPRLTSLPQGIKNLKALKDLWIERCGSLRLPGGESNELRLHSFQFKGLLELVSLPGWLEGSASTLQHIKIANCPKFRELPEWLKNCSSLRTLEIENCPRLSSRPIDIPHIRTLTKLRISNCGELSSCEIKL